MLTVAICTVDRVDQLRRTLRSLLAQEVSGQFDVVLVDNSADGSSRSVWDELSSAFGGLAEYAVVPEPGLSRARNAALELTQSEFVAFLDDDVTLPPTWLDALATALGAPGIVAAGGPIRLVWDGGRPAWLHREYETFFSALDLGGEPRDFRVPRESPYGANFVVDRQATIEVGGFDTRLGRTGASLIGGEEIDVIMRLAPRGAVRYVPGAWVYHHIQAARASRRWLLRRCWAQGRTEILVDSAAALQGTIQESPLDSVKAPLLSRLPYVTARRLGVFAATLERRAAVPGGAS